MEELILRFMQRQHCQGILFLAGEGNLQILKVESHGNRYFFFDSMGLFVIMGQQDGGVE